MVLLQFVCLHTVNRVFLLCTSTCDQLLYHEPLEGRAMQRPSVYSWYNRLHGVDAVCENGWLDDWFLNVWSFSGVGGVGGQVVVGLCSARI